MKSSLKNLDTEKLRDLGGALGLSYPNLKRMNAILDDMSAAWLNKEDNVLEKSGEPTWNRLVEALEKIGQMGVAEEIRNKKCCSDTGREASRNSKKHIYLPTVPLHALPPPPPPPPHTHTQVAGKIGGVT